MTGRTAAAVVADNTAWLVAEVAPTTGLEKLRPPTRSCEGREESVWMSMPDIESILPRRSRGYEGNGSNGGGGGSSVGVSKEDSSVVGGSWSSFSSMIVGCEGIVSSRFASREGRFVCFIDKPRPSCGN